MQAQGPEPAHHEDVSSNDTALSASNEEGAAVYDGDRDYVGSVDELEESMRNCGFTEAEADDLLCHGVQPWEDDAREFMDSLNEARDQYDQYETNSVNGYDTYSGHSSYEYSDDDDYY